MSFVDILLSFIKHIEFYKKKLIFLAWKTW